MCIRDRTILYVNCGCADVPNHQKVSEAGLLLTEVLTLVNQPANSPVTTLTLNAILTWLSKRDCLSVVVAALLRVLGTTVANQEILGTLLESTLTAFFRGRGKYQHQNHNAFIILKFVMQLN